MTFDDKIAVIEETLGRIESSARKAAALSDGALFELVFAVNAEFPKIGDALPAVKKILSNKSHRDAARFYRIFCKYNEGAYPLPSPESAELPATVIAPDIAKLDDAIVTLSHNGFNLKREYGDSFTACAEDVGFGHCRYVLLPYSNPEDGRLGAFEKLRIGCGLVIHSMCLIESENGVSKYQLCAAGCPDKSFFPSDRLLIRASIESDVESYLSGTREFGAVPTAFDYDGTLSGYCVRAELDVSRIVDIRSFSGLLMYLCHSAEFMIDGYYNEIR